MGRHAAGEDTTNVGVVGARSDVEDYLARVGEGGRDDGDVREVGAAVLGMVGDDDVAAFQLATPDFGLCADAGGHAAEVNGQMRC